MKEIAIILGIVVGGACIINFFAVMFGNNGTRPNRFSWTSTRAENVSYKCLPVVVIGLFLLTVIMLFSGCGGGSDQPTWVEQHCGEMSNCGGCCSHHGGVICLDGTYIMCADGTPLSDVCRAKGCVIWCCECRTDYPGDPCPPEIVDLGGPAYYSGVHEDSNAGFTSDPNDVETYDIYPIHVTYRCAVRNGFERLLGVYIVAHTERNYLSIELEVEGDRYYVEAIIPHWGVFGSGYPELLDACGSDCYTTPDGDLAGFFFIPDQLCLPSDGYECKRYDSRVVWDKADRIFINGNEIPKFDLR